VQQLSVNLPTAPERRKATLSAMRTVAHRSGGATPQSIAASLKARECTKVCIRCFRKFTAHDWKVELCKSCKTTCACGAPKTAQAKTCPECRRKSPRRLAQLERLHQAMQGENNPSKRPDIRKKISESLKGGKHAVYTRKEYRQRLVEQALYMQQQQRGRVRSKVEISVGSILSGFEPQLRVGDYLIDYASQEKMVAVEIQGCYWHCCPKCFPNGPETSAQVSNLKRDKCKAKYLSDNGWLLITVWEHEHNSMLALLKIKAKILHLCSRSKNNSALKRLTNYLTMMENALDCMGTHG